MFLIGAMTTENRCSSEDPKVLTRVHVCFVFLKGDYGGPLLCYGDSGLVQVGIMSYGSQGGCTLPGQPGVFTQVSKYLRYINDYIHLWELCSHFLLLRPHSLPLFLLTGALFFLCFYSFLCIKSLKLWPKVFPFLLHPFYMLLIHSGDTVYIYIYIYI